MVGRSGFSRSRLARSIVGLKRAETFCFVLVWLSGVCVSMVELGLCWYG